MEYKEHIYNSSVVLNAEGSCTINCPGCSFAVKERKETTLLSLDDLKKRIDFAAEKLENDSSLILLPGNILLEYNNEEIVEIFEYSCSKVPKVQWELEKIDERILDVLKLEKVSNLIKEKKIFLNLPCNEGDGDLLYEIYNIIYFIGTGRTKEILKENNLLDDFLKLDDIGKLNELNRLYEKGGILPSVEEYSILIVRPESEKGAIDVYNFLYKIGFNPDRNEIIKVSERLSKAFFHAIESSSLIAIHKPNAIKIDKNGNNIWDIKHEKGEESCMLIDSDFEWSISGNKEGTVIPHANPCINKLSFGNLESSSDDIEKAFLDHREKIGSIFIKYKYTSGFDQSELCRMCLEGDIPELTHRDIEDYKVRKFKYKFKKLFSKILFK